MARFVMCGVPAGPRYSLARHGAAGVEDEPVGPTSVSTNVGNTTAMRIRESGKGVSLPYGLSAKLSPYGSSDHGPRFRHVDDGLVHPDGGDASRPTRGHVSRRSWAADFWDDVEAEVEAFDLAEPDCTIEQEARSEVNPALGCHKLMISDLGVRRPLGNPETWTRDYTRALNKRNLYSVSVGAQEACPIQHT
ncbi:hypothetical protein R1flu_009160 [Riccia fluitans]|uniref:Uncharacterized protein n=1 Tax=Riccia fluitans TaxID=41844 RepID=A0ABD1Z1H0_9MARC